MKNNFLTIFLIVVLIGAFIFLGNLFLSNLTFQNLISPDGKNILQTVGFKKPIPFLTPTPIQYNFNKSTDLKAELETINPEVLNSDFDALQFSFSP